MKAFDCFDYAKALEKVQCGKDAIRWYEKFLELDKDSNDFMCSIAKERIAELK
jgi:phage terminase large subunit GpA-like protein